MLLSPGGTKTGLERAAEIEPCMVLSFFSNFYSPYPVSITAFSASRTVDSLSSNRLARKCSEKRNGLLINLTYFWTLCSDVACSRRSVSWEAGGELKKAMYQ